MRWLIIYRGMGTFHWELETKVTQDPGSVSELGSQCREEMSAGPENWLTRGRCGKQWGIVKWRRVLGLMRPWEQTLR